MLIQCLVEREGAVHIARLENTRYRFERNDHDGSQVCEITNKEHIKWMLKSGSYREYQPTSSESTEMITTLGKPAGEPLGSAQYGSEAGENAYAPYYNQADNRAATKAFTKRKRKAA